METVEIKLAVTESALNRTINNGMFFGGELRKRGGKGLAWRGFTLSHFL
ncbi:hypothetical protein J7E73_10055 [Paenibacillus albidus]|nr:hypothetical protein [Paenibacillus albidus]